MSTLRDISKSLGLSPATVSRALNGFPEVNEATRARVLEAAKRLDYRPNQIAQKLVTGRSNIVGLVIKRPTALATDTTFFGVVGGISASLAARNVDLVLHTAADEDEIAPYQRLVGKGILDGFILNAPRQNDPRIAYLTERNIPFVVHGRTSAEVNYPYYDIDKYQVSALAVDMLCDLGHRRIALINGPTEYSYTHDRRQGFVEALARRGLHTPEAFIFDGTLSETHGYTAALRSLGGTLGPAPTAFVCASTTVAVGVFRAIADKGLRVPEDISVIAHDDDVPQYPAVSFSPPLTVTRSPLTDACEPLADILLARIAKPLAAPQQVRAEPTFVVRHSTGAVPAGNDQPWPA